MWRNLIEIQAHDIVSAPYWAVLKRQPKDCCSQGIIRHSLIAHFWWLICCCSQFITYPLDYFWLLLCCCYPRLFIWNMIQMDQVFLSILFVVQQVVELMVVLIELNVPVRVSFVAILANPRPNVFSKKMRENGLFLYEWLIFIWMNISKAVLLQTFVLTDIQKNTWKWSKCWADKAGVHEGIGQLTDNAGVHNLEHLSSSLCLLCYDAVGHCLQLLVTDFCILQWFLWRRLILFAKTKKCCLYFAFCLIFFFKD